MHALVFRGDYPISNEEIKVIPFNPGERALRRLRRKGRDSG